jgi:hypothetical protein
VKKLLSFIFVYFLLSSFTISCKGGGEEAGPVKVESDKEVVESIKKKSDNEFNYEVEFVND